MSNTQSVKAVAKYIRMSPHKVRRVLNQIRGRSYQEALMILESLKSLEIEKDFEKQLAHLNQLLILNDKFLLSNDFNSFYRSCYNSKNRKIKCMSISRYYLRRYWFNF